MKLIDITEMAPQIALSTEFGFDDKIQNQKFAKKYYRSSKKEIIKEFPNGEILYKLGNKFILIDIEVPQIQYIVQYEIKNSIMLNHQTIQQVKVWRNDLSHNVKGLAELIFFKKLLPLTDIIVTDALQTYDGKKFWFNRIMDAFRLNLNLYSIDLNKKKSLMKFDDHKELQKFIDSHYGHKEQFKTKRLIISSISLK
jgi:hypothetical protein